MIDNKEVEYLGMFADQYLWKWDGNAVSLKVKNGKMIDRVISLDYGTGNSFTSMAPLAFVKIINGPPPLICPVCLTLSAEPCS